MTLPYHPILLQYIPCDCTAHVRACMQDGTLVEWEEQLPLQDYAIRVPLWMTHKLPDILDAYVQSGRVKTMQKVLECAWRLHW